MQIPKRSPSDFSNERAQLNKPEKILKIALDYLQEKVVPQANQIDREPTILKQAFQEMGDRSLLALRVPENLGGGGFSELDYRQFQVAIARASGALAFLQTQHQSAASMLAASSNQFLQQTYLPKMATKVLISGKSFLF
jgi:alkylation response protein AidB-like acyl-CoA dehydrogenase